MTANAKILDFASLEEVAQKLGIDNPVNEVEDIYPELLSKYNIPLSVCRDLYAEVLPYKGGYRLAWTKEFEHVVWLSRKRAARWAALKYEQCAVLEGVKFSSGKMVLVAPCSADDPDLRYTFDVAPVEWVMRVYKREKSLIDRPAIFVMAPAGVEVDPKSDKREAAPKSACSGHGAVDTGTVAAVDGVQAEKLLTVDTETLAAMNGKLPYGYFSATENGDGGFGVLVIRGKNGEIEAVKVLLP